MTPEKQERLHFLRSENQLKLETEHFYNQHIEPLREVIDYFRKENMHLEIEGFCDISENMKKGLSILLRSNNLPYNMDGNRKADDIMNRALLTYPNQHSLRYVPELPLVAISPDANPIKPSTANLAISDQFVYLYYMGYSPLFRVSLNDLCNCMHEEIFNPWLDDAVIFPDDFSWLIAYSLEDEWYAGRSEG